MSLVAEKSTLLELFLDLQKDGFMILMSLVTHCHEAKINFSKFLENHFLFSGKRKIQYENRSVSSNFFQLFCEFCNILICVPRTTPARVDEDTC